MSLSTFQYAIILWCIIAIITFLSLVFTKIRAPYGRHANDKWGKMIPNHWGWFWMELPALLLFPTLAIFGPAEKNIITWMLVALWVLHYFYRTVIFPFQLNTRGKKMPLTIVSSAVFFNVVNGFLNGYFVGFIGLQDQNAFSANIAIGLLLFFTGMYINRSADRRLIALRTENTDYQIPRGWLFEYISCPNHFGEIMEWIGFALIAWNLPAVSFALWTFCNLIPRALNHHDWYQEYFDNYPAKRKAVLPFLW